uniref:Uncharacterized protein n=1 Tax=Rhizophagus irregularis (strain DAOM 181602 / DAOM 197198 / MUCL 43194) TaxID=747089 RepID=U9SQ34_RHIID
MVILAHSTRLFLVTYFSILFLGVLVDIKSETIAIHEEEDDGEGRRRKFNSSFVKPSCGFAAPTPNRFISLKNHQV